MQEKGSRIPKKIRDYLDREMTIYLGGALPIPLFRTKRKEVARVLAAGVIFVGGAMAFNECRDTEEVHQHIPVIPSSNEIKLSP